jgi:hypothetical protein
MDYRLSKKREEIIKNLTNRLTDSSLITVWQKDEQNNRLLLEKVPFLALFPDEGTFTLKLTKKDYAHFDVAKDLYFLLDEQNFVFKTTFASVQKDFMTLQIPKEMRLKEFRAHPRTYFSIQDKKYVDVIFSGKDDFKEIVVSCPLHDISEGGACIIVSKETISNIDFSSDVLLKFATACQTAVIKNARLFIKKNLKNDEFYAIGVQFQ